MQVTPIKTPIVAPNDDLFVILDEALPKLEERSVVAVTSKIVGLAEGRVVPVVTGAREEKQALAASEAEMYIAASVSQHDLLITIKEGVLAVNAGLDESNADHQYVLWPEKPYESAKRIWQHLREKHQLSELGVILTDSKTFPLKWGVVGTVLSHCGFSAINSKIGDPDLFGRPLKMTTINVAEALAVAAVLEMGEAAEAQPLCIITDAKMVQFQPHPPTDEEIQNIRVSLEEDVFSPILMSAPWQKK